MDKLLILSPCFYPTSEPAALMVESATRQGLNVMLYGMSEPFLPHGADAQVKRLVELMDELASIGRTSEYILVTDCRDVLFLAGEEEILKKVHGFSLIMSAESNCWPPDAEVLYYFYNHGGAYPFPNAGQYVGKWETVRHSLQHLLDNYRFRQPGADNSQGWWALAKARGELGYEIDSGCRIFQTMNGASSNHVQLVGNGRVRNVITGSFPCSVHFNGNPSNDAPQQEMYERLFR